MFVEINKKPLDKLSRFELSQIISQQIKEENIAVFFWWQSYKKLFSIKKDC